MRAGDDRVAEGPPPPIVQSRATLALVPARLLFKLGRIVVAGAVLVACGSTGSQPAPGVDGSSATDAAQGVNDAGDAAQAVDAAKDNVDAAVEDAPAGPEPDGGAWLDGSMAFGVHYSAVFPQNLQVACGYAPGPSTGYSDLVVFLTDIDLSSACTNGTLTQPDAAAGHPFVRIEVESPSYAPDGGGLAADGGPVAPIGPGSYAIGFEPHQTAGDVCMLSSTSGTALVDVLRFGALSCCATALATSVSGTVTLTTVVPGHVAGNFQVSLAPVDGGVNAQAAAPLSGGFDTTACPGVIQ
jgi:hypothetical protein